MGLYGEEYFLEYSGNAKDNESFSKACEDMDKMFAIKVEILKKLAAHLEKCADVDARTVSELAGKLDSLYKDAESTVRECDKLKRDSRSDKVTKEFNRIASKLKVKYSSATIEERKKYDDIFVKYLNEILDIIDIFEGNGYNISRIQSTLNDVRYDYKYSNGSEWQIKMEKNCKIFDAIDSTLGEKYEDHCYEFYNKEFYKFFKETRTNLKTAIRKVDSDKDNRVLYKLVQKLFKDKEDK